MEKPRNGKLEIHSFYKEWGNRFKKRLRGSYSMERKIMSHKQFEKSELVEFRCPQVIADFLPKTKKERTNFMVTALSQYIMRHDFSKIADMMDAKDNV